MKEFPHFIPKPSFYHRPAKTVKLMFPIDSENRNEENGTPIEKEENQKSFSIFSNLILRIPKSISIRFTLFLNKKFLLLFPLISFQN
jgi:hypothetical protein